MKNLNLTEMMPLIRLSGMLYGAQLGKNFSYIYIFLTIFRWFFFKR